MHGDDTPKIEMHLAYGRIDWKFTQFTLGMLGKIDRWILIQSCGLQNWHRTGCRMTGVRIRSIEMIAHSILLTENTSVSTVENCIAFDSEILQRFLAYVRFGYRF